MIYVEKFQDMINDDIDEWIYFFKYAQIKDDFKSPGIRLLASKLDYLMMDIKEKRAYDKYLEYLSYEYSVIDNAVFEGLEKGRKEGREEGREEGIEIGIEKGKAVGREEGLEIGIEKGKAVGREEGFSNAIISIATNLLYENSSVEKIHKLTGLSIQKIKEISKNIGM
jgi:predicted transposase YdaD